MKGNLALLFGVRMYVTVLDTVLFASQLCTLIHQLQIHYMRCNVQAGDFSGFFLISGVFTKLPLPENVCERREVVTKETKK